MKKYRRGGEEIIRSKGKVLKMNDQTDGLIMRRNEPKASSVSEEQERRS